MNQTVEKTLLAAPAEAKSALCPHPSPIFMVLVSSKLVALGGLLIPLKSVSELI